MALMGKLSEMETTMLLTPTFSVIKTFKMVVTQTLKFIQDKQILKTSLKIFLIKELKGDLKEKIMKMKTRNAVWSFETQLKSLK